MNDTGGVSERGKLWLELSGVTKRFGEDLVLKETNLSLEAGCVYGIVGNNGSGKTVLMKCICGFLTVSTGTVRVFGSRIGKDTDFPESLGVIIETPGFLTNLTGRRNLEILADMRRKITKADVRIVLRKVGLDPDDKRTFRKYSLGMKQRLGIAAAIMENPDIVILDEPINALDDSGAELVRSILWELRDNGSLIMLACHDTDELRYLSDEIYTLNEGRITEKIVDA